MEPSETNSIFRDHSETFNTKDYQYASQKASSICCESKIYYPEGKDSQAYVWNISQLWISSKQQGDSQPKSKMYEDIGVDSEICPNIRGKNGMQLSFGQLCRVGTIGIAKRKNKGIQCNYVYAKYEHKNGGDGPVCTISESSRRNESEGLGLGNSLEEVESRLKSNKQINRVVWTAEYDGVKYQALPDYDVEAAERAQRAERARKTKTKGVKNKYLKNKKK
ncbi:unnamed protein product [Rhizophagus irregularis]|nr:unnamed protein product [Rhizophagus irregularis]